MLIEEVCEVLVDIVVCWGDILLLVWMLLLVYLFELMVV